MRVVASTLLKEASPPTISLKQSTMYTATQRNVHNVSGAATVEEDRSSDEECSATERLQNLGPEDEKRLKVLQLEYDVWMSTGSLVPENMTDEMWADLLFKCPSLHSRKSKYKFWFKREKAIAKDKRKKSERQIVYQQRMKELDKLKVNGQLPLLNTYMLFVRESTMNRHYYSNLAHAMMFGQTLVFDFAFEEHMKERELINLADQMNTCHGSNKIAKEPFHFHFCNVPPHSSFQKRLYTSLPGLENLPISVSSENYLDIYPPEKLVYLTPDSNNVLGRYNHDDIYIIGGLVDKSVVKPFTFAKAKSEKIRTAKLPLDQYLIWTQGTKNLALNHVVNILHNVKETGDWEKAFSHIPKRKTRRFN
ncbi:RNA (guanine-9-)-methyltransferase domain-containing protein 1 [Lamellibrachia satsuma]|nr:RNA (guanine-9-)-methyltransferase domain-containing protein 1 [Lamellibrachia satsuma]